MQVIVEHPDIVEVERQLCLAAPPVIFFIGAGLSKPLGFPLWHELLHELIEYGRRIQRLPDPEAEDAEELAKNGDFLKCGDMLRRKMGVRVDQKLREIFSEKSPADLGIYDYLVRLPCAGYVTTNYDTLLETAFARHHGRNLLPILPMQAKNLGTASSSSPFYIKLHGDAARHEFVLSAGDYSRLLRNEILRRFLYAMFLHYKIVFLGYGLSDRDILEPLRLVARDYKGASRRHVALLPQKTDRMVREKLEDKAGTNVALYDASKGHEAVEEVVLRWFIASQEAKEKGAIFEDPQVVARLLQTRAIFLEPYLRNIAERGSRWLISCPTHWGAYPQGSSKAANIAEALIALDCAQRVLGKRLHLKHESLLLTGYQNDDGGVISESFAMPTVHATALAVFGLMQYEELDPQIIETSKKACDWLLRNRKPGGGWGTFGKPGLTRVVPSIWSFAALGKGDQFPESDWAGFRERLLDCDSIEYVIGGNGKSLATASWVLWLLAYLKTRGWWDSKDEQLLEKALAQILAHKGGYLNENEAFQIDEGGPPAKRQMWVSWIHSTAPIVVLGALPWLDRDSKIWGILGKSISSLMEQASDGADGHFREGTTEHEGGAPFVFQTSYSLWALCELIQMVFGVRIHKIGMLVVEKKRLLLLRKRGTRQLILPGGCIEEGESPESSLRREILEELGVAIASMRYWKSFEDVAAFERGATVHIDAYRGSLTGPPKARAEIAEYFWVDSHFASDELSPIVRNKILPDLIREELVN